MKLQEKTANDVTMKLTSFLREIQLIILSVMKQMNEKNNYFKYKINLTYWK